MQWVLQLKLWVRNSENILLLVSNLEGATCNLIEINRIENFICRCQCNRNKSLPIYFEQTNEQRPHTASCDEFYRLSLHSHWQRKPLQRSVTVTSCLFAFCWYIKKQKQFFWLYKAWKWIVVALYPKLPAWLKLEEQTLGGNYLQENGGTFAVHNNDGVTDVLHSGRQRWLGRKRRTWGKKRVRKSI